MTTRMFLKQLKEYQEFYRNSGLLHLKRKEALNLYFALLTCIEKKEGLEFKYVCENLGLKGEIKAKEELVSAIAIQKMVPLKSGVRDYGAVDMILRSMIYLFESPGELDLWLIDLKQLTIFIKPLHQHRDMVKFVSRV